MLVDPFDDGIPEGLENVSVQLIDGGSLYHIGMNTVAEVNIADNDPGIVITYDDGIKVNQKDGLKVAKWKDAFEIASNAQSVRVKGPNMDKLDFIDRDPDRFNVWVYNKAAWDKNTPHFEATISTKNVAGFEDYNDSSTKIDLVRYTGAKTPNNRLGWYWSDSQMLVSNGTDDKYSDKTYLGADEADPAVDTYVKHGYTFKVTDRTHRVALGGTVKAEATVGGMGFEASAPVPAKHGVNIHVNILKDKVGGAAVVGEPAVWSDIARMREIYAQVQIRVNVVGNKLSTVDPSGVVDLDNGLSVPQVKNGQLDLSQEVIDLLTLRSPPVNNKYVIEVYYVNKIVNVAGDSVADGFAVPLAGVPFAQLKYIDSVVLNNKHGYTTLAHEVAHILENLDGFAFSFGGQQDPAHYPYLAWFPTLVDTVNLMIKGRKSVETGDVADSRRLTPQQQARMTTVDRLVSGP